MSCFLYFAMNDRKLKQVHFEAEAILKGIPLVAR